MLEKVAGAGYSELAYQTFEELDLRVSNCFERVKLSRAWALIADEETPTPRIVALLREIFRAVCWYQPHTTEAGFHMFGRLPKSDVRLIQALCGHKAEEAEHGVWAREDYRKLGGDDQSMMSDSPSPATFAVASIWWRMAQVEEPLAYLGPEYLFEQLTALVAPAALQILSKRKLPREGLRFIVEHAVEDQKHATFLKHTILDVVTRYPASAPAMLRCYEYFEMVYPLAVWDEAFERSSI
jgi:hypothetical protein